MRAVRRSGHHGGARSAGPELLIAVAAVGAVAAIGVVVFALVAVAVRVFRRWQARRRAGRQVDPLPTVSRALAERGRETEPALGVCMAPGCTEAASHRSFDGPWTWCRQHAGLADIPLLETKGPCQAVLPQRSAEEAKKALEKPLLADEATKLLEEPLLAEGSALSIGASQKESEASALEPRPQLERIPAPEPIPRPEAMPALQTGSPVTAGPGEALQERLAAARERLEEARVKNPYPTPERFHSLARRYLEGLGHRIETERPLRDFDRDLVVVDPAGQKVLVRCRWRVETRRNHLETLLREMTWIGADRAMMIACGWFGRKTQIWAEDQPLVLVDGVQIGALKPLDAGGHRPQSVH